MIRVAVDCFNFVGLSNGAGGSGSYVLSLLDHMARLTPVVVAASPRNAHLFRDLEQRLKRLTVLVSADEHDAAVRQACFDADILYAPFTMLPERETYAQTPAVTAIHDLQHRMLKSFFPFPERADRDRVYFSACNAADGILTFATAEKNNIFEAYRPRVPIGVVPHAPFLHEQIRRAFGQTELTPERNPYVAKYGRYLLYPAVNWPHKNHYRIIEAFDFLCNAFGVPEVKLLLVGAPCVEERRHYYESLLNTPRTTNRVLHLGFVSNVQLFQLMTGAELLVFPTMYEGFGIPMVEAMAVETAVIASDLPLFREWFAGAYEPFRDFRDSLAMAEDLHRLLTDRDRLGELRRAGREASKEFSSARMAAETLEFLETIAADAESGSRKRGGCVAEVRSLARKSCRVLIHVLVKSTRKADLGKLSRAIVALRAKPGFEQCGFVLTIPYDSASTTGASASLGQLSAEVERLYFDPQRPEHRAFAMRYYVDTQVDAAFHRFATSDDIIRLAAKPEADLADVSRACREAEGIDGYYVGSANWDSLRFELRQLASADPARLAQLLRAGERVSLFDFVLVDNFVRNTGLDWYGAASLTEVVLRASVKTPRPRFAYVETQLASQVGHHLGLVEGICRAAAASGFEPLIGANREAITGSSDGTSVDACFANYADAPNPHVNPTHFANELADFISRHRLAAGDFVYMHMPYPTLLAGMLQYVVTNDVEDMPVFLVRICSDDESFRWHDIKLTKLARIVAELGSRGDRIRFFVESLPLQRYFERAAGVAMPILLNPISQDLVFAAEVAREAGDRTGVEAPVTFGYFGEAREEKGFLLLPAIVEAMLSKHGPEKVSFVLQVSATPVNDSLNIQKARARLKELQAKFAKASRKPITLYETGFDDMSSYFTALAACDAMLMPYDPKAYDIRGSGVALEALSVGQPIIASAGTDMAETFAGAGCLVAPSYTGNAFVETCSLFLSQRAEMRQGVRDYVAASSLFKHEQAFIKALTASPAQTRSDKPIAVWIGNDTLSQGVSAVYDSQRDFLRAEGYEIYNVYVPFPDLNGGLLANETLEKQFIRDALGWRTRGYDFGCYSWMLNQSDREGRRALFDEIRTDGPSFARFYRMNGYFEIPPSLRRLIETRRVELVCLNYVHLYPIAEMLGLAGRADVRVVLETHDIQAYQYAIRRNRPVDTDDRAQELQKLGDANHIIAISWAEYDEIRESNPWLDVSFVLPQVRIDQEFWRRWQPGVTGMKPDWLELWRQREDLQTRYDLSTVAGLTAYARWVQLYGRLEAGNLAKIGLDDKLNLEAAHPEFPVQSPELRVSRIVGWIWDDRPDLRRAFPDARDPNHPDRSGYLAWVQAQGVREFMLDSIGGVRRESLYDESSQVSPALVETFLLAGLPRLDDFGFRERLFGWLARNTRMNCLIVGSDHPSNISSIQSFIEEGYATELVQEGLNLVVAGRVCNHLDSLAHLPNLLLLGEVERLDPLYRVTDVLAVPVFAGSGAPIKALDGLARGLCISTSQLVDRSLRLSSYGFPLAETAAEMARDVRELVASESLRSDRRALAESFARENLSPEIARQRWRAAIGRGQPIVLEREQAMPVAAQ